MATAAPGLLARYETTVQGAPLAYVSAPLTYAEPATLTKYETISSPLTYTASHQPAIAVRNALPIGLTYSAGYPVILLRNVLNLM